MIGRAREGKGAVGGGWKELNDESHAHTKSLDRHQREKGSTTLTPALPKSRMLRVATVKS